MEITPSSVLAMWAAGLAAASAIVAWWRVVGSGYGWLAAAVTLLLGVPAALAGGGAWALAGCVLVALGIPFAAGRAIVPFFGLGALAFGAAAVPDGGIPATLTGAVLLGGITAEMMLGHWFLVDPRLPRSSLRHLDLVAAVGAVADLGAMAVAGAFPWEGTDLAVGVGYLVLAVTTIVLIGAVWASLGEPGYPAVMSATGLSYLAVLTAIGAVVLGRLLAGGSVLG
ncbi:MAG: hypothetical protein MUP76_07990 [Acidimicrobiia bacterium]|nr:hypothetical protein [Acidimicrobiia bacterium]